MTRRRLEVFSESAEETAAIGAMLGGWLRDGDVVLLHGDLGAGKTIFAKGIATALGIDDVVSSPSFSLVNEYETGAAETVSRLYHLDLFRLVGEDDLASIGFGELTAPDSAITLVEWPECAGELLPNRYVLIELTAVGTNRRVLRISTIPDVESWKERFGDLEARFSLVLA